MMIHFHAKILFRTRRPISQETGLEMWKLGSNFRAMPGHGGRTYQLTATGQSMSAMDALTVLTEAIQQNTVNDGHNEATITSIEISAE